MTFDSNKVEGFFSLWLVHFSSLFLHKQLKYEWLCKVT